MSDFLRPEARAALARWREVLIALPVFALGLWWGLTAFGILKWLGWALAAFSGSLLLAGIQRGRFWRGGGGAGVVQFDEAKVTYLGPFGGGSVDLGDMVQLDIDRGARPAHWWLIPEEGMNVAVPVNAEGADKLFDAFAALPGLSPSALVAAQTGAPAGRETIWVRPGATAQDHGRVINLHPDH